MNNLHRPSLRTQDTCPRLKKAMKRILFITKSLTIGGGIEKHIVDLANGLCEKGFATAILVFEMQDEKGGRIKDLNPDVEIILAGGNYQGPSRRPFGLRGTYEALKAIRKWKPDALCAMSMDAKPLAAVVGRLSNTKTVLVESSSPQLDLLYSLPRRWRIWPKSFALYYREKVHRLADVVVGVSEGAARGARQSYQLKKVKAVQNGINIDEIVEKSKTAEGVAHEYFREGLPVLVATGRLETQKDYPNLLEAFKIVNETAEARLIVVGGGKLKGKLQHLAKSLEIDDKIAMVGETVPYAYMRHGDIFVHSALYEGFGIVLIEAMGLGMPTVSTDCNYGPNEIIENGENGLLVPVADPEKLAAAILKLIGNKELRLKLGKKAEERARYFNRDRMVSGYEEVFTNL